MTHFQLRHKLRRLREWRFQAWDILDMRYDWIIRERKRLYNKRYRVFREHIFPHWMNPSRRKEIMDMIDELHAEFDEVIRFRDEKLYTLRKRMYESLDHEISIILKIFLDFHAEKLKMQPLLTEEEAISQLCMERPPKKGDPPS